MKKPRLSNLPVTLALVIIFVFGVPPTVLISLYEYRLLSKNAQEMEDLYMEWLKGELRQDLAATVNIIDYQRNEAKKQLRGGVRSVVNDIHEFTTQIHARFGGKLSDPELRNLIRGYLQEMRIFQGRGYFFAFSLDGVGQLHSPDLIREGGRQGGLSTAGSRDLSQEMVARVKKDGAGFFRYSWPFPDQPERMAEKIAYARFFQPLGWVIGFGDYLEAFDYGVKQEMIQHVRRFNTDNDTIGFILDDQGHLLIGGDDSVRDSGSDPGRRLEQALAGMIDSAREPGGCFTTYGPEILVPGFGEPASMVAHARYYAPWGWTIGTLASLKGFKNYSAGRYEKLKQRLVEKLIFLALVMVLAMVFVFVIGKLFAWRMEKNLVAFVGFFRRAGNSPEQIDLDKLPFSELQVVGQYANAMVAERVKNEEMIQQVNDQLRLANERLQQMADLDGLTKVANRRFFDDALAREWARAARDRRPVTLGMVDIDQFKAYNDTYGHPAGDDCLKQVAGALKAAVKRPADLLARYGGEEFVVLLPDTELAGGETVARWMQDSVAALAMPHEAAPGGRVSFSMGLACAVPGPGIEPESLIARADQALYRAKTAGRNRIELAPETQT